MARWKAQLGIFGAIIDFIKYFRLFRWKISRLLDIGHIPKYPPPFPSPNCNISSLSTLPLPYDASWSRLNTFPRQKGVVVGWSSSTETRCHHSSSSSRLFWVFGSFICSIIMTLLVFNEGQMSCISQLNCLYLSWTAYSDSMFFIYNLLFP